MQHVILATDAEVARMKNAVLAVGSFDRGAVEVTPGAVCKLMADLADSEKAVFELQAELAQLRAEKAAALEQKPVCGCIVTDFGQWPQFYREADMTLWELPVGNHNLYAAPTPATVPDDNLLPVLLKTSPFITCVSGDGKPKVVLQFSSLTDAQDVFCAIHNGTILQSAQEPKPYGYKYRVKDAFGHEVIVDDNRGRPILETIPLYAKQIPAATAVSVSDESQLQKAANHQYEKDTLKSLYQAWEMLPCCNLMAVIGGAIQDIQAMQSCAKATVPDGWSIRREGEHIVIQKSDIGGVVVKQNPSEAREIPEAILWALANDLLKAAQEPKP